MKKRVGNTNRMEGEKRICIHRRLSHIEIEGVAIFLCTQYHSIVIKSFADKETERLFRREFTKRIPQALYRAAWKKLVMLDASEKFDDLRIPPGNHLEKLTGQRRGQYSIRINDQWRICFSWIDGNAVHVEITDYH